MRILSSGVDTAVGQARSSPEIHQPCVVGYEFCGEVTAVGENVTRWQVGDIVTSGCNLVCGHCDMCRAGRDALCRVNIGQLGRAMNGVLAQTVNLPEAALVSVPTEVDPWQAGAVVQTVATAYHLVVKQLRVRPYEHVAVTGAGSGQGLHVLEMIRAHGAVPIAVESDPEKVSALREHGSVETVIDSSAVNLRNALVRASGHHLAGYLDLVCSPETLRAGPSCLGPRGTLVAARPPALASHSRTLSALLPEYTWVGEHRASRQEIALTLNLVATGLVRVWIGARFPLADVEKAFAAAKAGTAFGNVALDIADPGDG